MKKSMARLPSRVVVLAGLYLYSLTAHGQTFNWTAFNGGNWNTASSWDVGAVPSNENATVNFNATNGVAYSVSIFKGESFTVGTLNLVGDVGGGPILNFTSGTLMFDGAATINAETHPAAGSGINVSLVFLQNATINTSTPNSLLNISSPSVTGTGVSLTKIGPGEVEFGSDAAISLTGPLNVKGGTLTIFNALDLGTPSAPSPAKAHVGNLEITGATVNVAGKLSLNSGGILSVGTGFAINGPFTSGAFVHNGPLTADGGVIQTLASITFPNDVALATRGVTLDSNGFDSTFSGAFSGTGGLTKINLGTITLTGANTYSGGTFLNGGVLAVADDSNLGRGDLTFNGGTLEALASITSAKAVKLNAGGGTFLADASTNSTLSGVIVGVGSFTKDGLGTLTLTADNTYSGGTTISAGTLQLGDGGTTGSIIGNVTDNGTLVFNHSGGKKTFDGVISGSGSLVKLGSDILDLTANNTYSGETTIQDGVLVAGVPVAGQETSFALGKGNVFLNGGTLRAPSLDPLVINVGGNYAQGPGGTLALGVAGVNGEDYDRVQVAGSASLSGKLAVSSLNGFRPVNLDAFEVLRSGGPRSGKFSAINDTLNNNPNLQRVDVYAPNGVALVYLATGPGPTPTPIPPVPTPAPTPPPIIDVIPTPLPPVDPETPIPLSFLLKILNPTVEQLTSMFEIPLSGANTQRFNLNDRMAQIRQGSTGFVSPLPTLRPSGKGTVLEKDGKAPPPVLQPSPQNRWGVWLNGWGDWVSVDNDNGIKGYDFTTGGVSAGLDYRITNCLAVGLFGTYAHTWTSLSPGDVDVDTGRGGVYATYWNQGFYVNGGVYGGYNGYDTRRQTLLQGRFASGSTSGYEISTFFDTGYDFQFGNLSFGPVFAAQYTNVHIDSYTERASFLPLNIHSDSEESWRTDLGIKATYTCHVGQIIVIPSLWAAWEHEYKYSALPITFSAAQFPAARATVFGPSVGHDSAIINAGAGVQWTPRISTYIGYQGQLGRSKYEANGVTGTFSFSF